MNRNLGMMVTLLPAIALSLFVVWAGENPAVIGEIARVSPWTAAHITWLGFAATLIITAFAGRAIVRDAKEGSAMVEARGEIAGGVLFAIGKVAAVIALIIAVGYLAGLGWAAAKSALGA